MSEEKIIGKGTWIDKLASELIEREKKLGRNLDLIRVESGLGSFRNSTHWKFRRRSKSIRSKTCIGEYGIQIRINCIFR